MLFFSHKSKAQTVVEFVMIAACFVIAMVVMRKYIQGGLAAKYKSSVDSTLGGQYDPKHGDFSSVSIRSGVTESVSDFETRTREGSNDTAYYMVNWMASGPDEVKNVNNVTMLKQDPSRVPMTSRSMEYSELSWKNFTVDD